MENAMSTTPTDRQVMDERQIIALHEAGDIDTLAAALRNVIRCTDHATRGAQEQARQMEEWVPVVLDKGEIYRALDHALAADPANRLVSDDPFRPLTAEQVEAAVEWEAVEDDVAQSFHDMKAIIGDHYWADDVAASLDPAEREALAAAAVEFVLVAEDHGYFPEPKTAVDTDSTLRGEQ
jgi:hypothetical protein